MAEQTRKMGQAKKAEGNLDPSKKGTESAGDAAIATEVEGHAASVYVHCPTCGSLRHVWLHYEGEWFNCGNCNSSYQVWI
jgi:hypothetical protein